MKKLKWVIEIDICESWVADGFNIPEDHEDKGEGWIIDLLQQNLPFAYSHELGGRVIKRPCEKLIRKIQGYKD